MIGVGKGLLLEEPRLTITARDQSGVTSTQDLTDFAASLGLERLVLRSDSVTAASLGDLIAEIEADLAGVAEEMEVSVVRYRDRLHTASKRLEAVLG